MTIKKEIPQGFVKVDWAESSIAEIITKYELTKIEITESNLDDLVYLADSLIIVAADDLMQVDAQYNPETKVLRFSFPPSEESAA